MAKRYGFPKTERLKSRRQIEELFAGGKSFSVFPIRVTYLFQPATDEKCVEVGVTASKRNFKKAVDRNRIKRMLREAYRLQKQELATQLKEKRIKAVVFFMYTDKTIATFEVIQLALSKCLNRLRRLAADENPV